MTILDIPANLELQREKAKLTQHDIASLLGISQPQVSRYEKNPEDIPNGLYRRWVAFLGEMTGAQGLEMADPRGEINARLNLLASYAGVEPKISADSPLPADLLSGANFVAGAKLVAGKPTIGVFGPFDGGKSRFLNSIIGGNRLPTSYQPKTSVMCLIRHMNDKPAWQVEDVWLFGKGYDFSKVDDQEHSLAHKIVAGGAESLAQYGTHDGSGKDLGAYAAVLYVDTPVLLGANLMDAPGYANDKADDERAELGKKLVDVAIYASPINGFMDQLDANNLGGLLRMLPVSREGQFSALDNVYVLATHAHTVAGAAERNKVLDIASTRVARNLELLLNERAESAGTNIGPAELRARFFTFSADSPEIRADFEKAFIDQLTASAPGLALKGLDQYVRQAKAAATGACERVIAELQTALDERDRAQAEVRAIEAGESDRRRKKAAHETKIVDMIDNFSKEAQGAVSELFSSRTSVSAIESMIRNRYSDKKEARESAASHLVTSIQQQVDSALKVRSNKLAEEVEGFLEEFQPAVDPSIIKTSGFDFNARAAFMGAMTGMSTVGALAAWASIAAAGSNLGGYILTAQMVGWLSSIGISFGSSSAVMGAIATMGGPVTLAIAAGIAAGFLAFSLFGDSWQTKLAKKISAALVENKAQSKIQEGVAKFWRDTKNAFTQAVEKTETDYQARLTTLRTLAFDTQRETLEKAIAEAKEVRDFFAGMPWRALN